MLVRILFCILTLFFSFPNTFAQKSTSLRERFAAKKGESCYDCAPLKKLVITSRFSKNRWGRPHCGNDLDCVMGEDIRAVMGGTVVHASKKGGYGNTVEIEYAPGKSHLYGHLSKIFVRKGQKVSAGHIIGAGGNSGNTTGKRKKRGRKKGGDGTHLHFEERNQGKPHDTLSKLKATYQKAKSRP